MNTKQITVIAAVSLFAVLALSPVATAADFKKDNGSISRTFLGWGSIDFKNDVGTDVGGAGWYDPDDRDNLCLVRLFGFPINVGFYYETLRKTTNAFNIHVWELGAVGTDVPCVVPGSTDPPMDPQFLGTSGTNLWLSPMVDQDHLLCFETFSLCAPDPDTAEWKLYVCPKPASYVPGDLLDLGLGLGGAAIVKGSCDPDVKYDASGFLTVSSNKQSSGGNPDGHVHIDQIVPPGSPDAVVVSCYEVDYIKIPDPLGKGTYTAASHDWFGVISDGSSLPNDDYFLPPLAGWYDLSGDNGGKTKDGRNDPNVGNCPVIVDNHDEFGNPGPDGIEDDDKKVTLTPKPKGNALIQG